MRKKIFIKGPVLSRTGYGEQTRFALRSLLRHTDRYDIFLDAIPWGQSGWLWEDNEERKYIDSLLVKTQQYIHSGGQFDLSLQVTIPNEWTRMAPINIGYTAGIESNVVSPTWLEKCKIIDKIIVVSEHAKRGFEEASYDMVNEQEKKVVGQLTCEAPIDVVHYPVRKYKKSDVNFEFETDFNFLVIAQNGPRKNVENTIKWFVEKFHDNSDVGLVLKMFKHGNCTMDAQYNEKYLATLMKKHEGHKCKVYFLHGDLTDEEMTSLYQHKKIKAFVTLTHGEGYGLPIFEAAYNGVPVVAPPWSGHVDYLYMPNKDKNRKKVRKSAMFAKIDYELDYVQKGAVWKDVIEEYSKWCYPKKDSYKMMIGDVYTNYEKHRSKAQKLKKHILENFEEEKIYNQFVSSIDKLFGDDVSMTSDDNTVVIL